MLNNTTPHTSTRPHHGISPQLGSGPVYPRQQAARQGRILLQRRTRFPQRRQCSPNNDPLVPYTMLIHHWPRRPVPHGVCRQRSPSASSNNLAQREASHAVPAGSPKRMLLAASQMANLVLPRTKAQPGLGGRPQSKSSCHFLLYSGHAPAGAAFPAREDMLPATC
jgi:hypothetical protein